MYCLKSIRLSLGKQGYAYSCDLYKNSKKIGSLHNAADGGPTRYSLSNEEKNELLIYAQKTLKSDYFEAHDEYIEILLNETL